MSDNLAKVKIKIKVKNSKLQGILKNLVAPKILAAQDGQGGVKSDGYGKKATALMGGKSEFKPPTPEDKKMSDRHISHRKEVDKTDSKLEAIKKSLKYNKEHKKEHAKAEKKARKMLQENA